VLLKCQALSVFLERLWSPQVVHWSRDSANCSLGHQRLAWLIFTESGLPQPSSWFGQFIQSQTKNQEEFLKLDKMYKPRSLHFYNFARHVVSGGHAGA
jgi:hypothetical protein